MLSGTSCSREPTTGYRWCPASPQPALSRKGDDATKASALDTDLFCREAQVIVARACLVSPPSLRCPSRNTNKIARARQIAMYLANVAGGVTLTDVGRGFGRDRTTVAHACAIVEDLRDEPSVDRSLDLLESALRIAFRLPAPGGPVGTPFQPWHPPRRQKVVCS